ncbi:ABC transporter substrate-binding protein [soil metagenome]
MNDLTALLRDVSLSHVNRRELLARAAALGVSASLVAKMAASPQLASGQDAKVGAATDVLTFSAFNVDQAPLNIQNGDMDLYLFGLKTAGAQSLEGADDVRLIHAPASTLSLILNPAPANEGAFNPFSVREIRFAMQYLIDRDFIANDIYQGRALPMLTNISQLDYDQLTIFPVVSAANIAYDPDVATQQIGAAMEAAGATLQGDAWTFNGSPVMVKIVTRVEDERRDIGDLVRSTLEGIGFQVQPIYQQFGPATLAVYASDPKTFQWHIYTEGWGRGAAVRYDDAGINQFAAPWLGNMPGWQEVGFWQYENETLDDLGQRLYRGEFASREERDALYQEMTGVALDESVRVWLVTALQSFPIRTEVEHLTEDIVSGPRNVFALRGAEIPGSNEIRVGNLWVWTERTTWNPVAGFGDVYSSDVYKNMVDSPIINHPFTGLPNAFRADFAVETAGPDGTLEVPGDAVMWDAAQDVWTPVGDGVTAKSKVTFDYTKYLQATWHHGPPITMADVIYPIAQGYEIAFDDAKVQIETALGITARPLYETFRGYRFGESTVEVFVDYWHFEEGYIGSYASPSSVSTPWELLAAMDDVVFEKRQGAYSDTAAARFTVPWISLVTESDARLVLRSITQFRRENSVPAGYFEVGGASLVSEEEAIARYDACDAWFEATNLLMLANGPYQLTRYDPPAQFAQLDAFRPEGYPFTVEDFRFGTPPSIVIEPVAAVPVVLGDEISIPVTVTGPGELTLQYTFVDPAAGAVLETSEAEAGADGSFVVTIDPAISATLFPGLYQVFVIAASSDIALVAQQRIDLEIGV